MDYGFTGYVGVKPVVGQQVDTGNLPLDDATKTHVSEWLERCNATVGEEAVKDIKVRCFFLGFSLIISSLLYSSDSIVCFTGIM